MIHIANGLHIYLRKRWDGWYWSTDIPGYRLWTGPWSTKANAIHNAEATCDPWKRPLPVATDDKPKGSTRRKKHAKTRNRNTSSK
jgi:hypothetical protein